MTLSVFKINQGERGRTLFYEAGYSLAGYSDPRFSMRNRQTGAVLLDNAAAVICDGTFIIENETRVLTPADGIVYYAWGATDLDLPDNYEGEFRLTAPSGQFIFEPSGNRYITILVNDSIGSTVSLPLPSGVAITSPAGNAARVTFTGASGAVSHEIAIGLESAGTFPTSTTGTSPIDFTGVAPGIYRARVRAVFAGPTYGGWVLSAGTVQVDYPPPTGVTLTSPSELAARLAFTGAAGAVSYEGAIGIEGAGTYPITTTGAGSPLDFTGLAAGTYVGRVRAVFAGPTYGAWVNAAAPVVVSAFTAFAFAAETDTLAASFAVAPTAARKRTIDTAIKRLKAAGVWAKCTALYMIGADENASLKNWKTPGTYDLLKVGTPTFAADDGWTGNAIGQLLNTQMPLNTLAQNDHSAFVFTKTTVGSLASAMGAVDGSAIGITIAPRNSGVSAVTGRSANASSTIIASSETSLVGFVGVSRDNSANFQPYRNGVATALITSASSPLSTVPVHLLNANNNNNAPTSFYPDRIGAAFMGQALTAQQVRVLHGVMREYLDALTYGEWAPNETGIGAATVTADCIAYGATPQSVTFALQAARAGKSVAIVGGFRDRHVGGMSAGGLGFTDFDTLSGMGGLPRWIVTQMNTIQGVADTTVPFRPRNFTRVMNRLLDPARNGGYTIPVYWSNGVTSVTKTGTRIDSLTTVDGRTFNGRQFFDGSYEGDLLVKAGASHTFGREAAGSGAEALNGYRGVLTTDAGNNHQFKTPAGTVVYVDPWQTPGDTGSGLVNQVHGIYSTFSPVLNNQPALGTADTKSQAYNFRLTMTNSAQRRVPLPTTAPPGFNIADYELLLRYLAANPTVTFTDIFKCDLLYTSTYDVNAKWGFSTDFWAANHSYPTATYAQREVIWKAHWNWIMGLLYLLQQRPDARVPVALQTAANLWGFVDDHYVNPHPNDDYFAMPQLYVRECVRMQSDVVMNGVQVAQADGATPTLGTKTISVASYAMDSHAVQRLAYEYAAGQWGTWNEGNFEAQLTGDKIVPIPLDICVPKASEVTNLSVGFAVSSTHVAFGSIRMEFTAMQIGQSMGQAAAQADTASTTIQAVDYAAVRAALLASASLPGEVAPVLPQVT